MIGTIKLDTIGPVNQADVITFKLVKVGEEFYLRYSVNGSFDNTSKIKIKYEDGEEYCVVDSNREACGKIDETKGVEEEGKLRFNFKSEIEDKAKNKSEEVSYEVEYNALRSFELSEEYVFELDTNSEIKEATKKVVVTINVDKQIPSRKIGIFNVYNFF